MISAARRRAGLVRVAAISAVFMAAVACGDAGKKETAAPADGSKPKIAIVYSAQFKDGSWGEAALTGVQKLKSEGAISDYATQENVPPGAAAVRALRDYASRGYNPVIAHSFNYGDDVKKVAKEFPKTLFAYGGGFGDVKGNVADYAQPYYQATYLEGILAAGATTGGKVAGAGGFDIPVCRAMYNAFLAGAKLVRPSTTGSFVAVGDWYDVQKAKEAALSQADAGATMFVGCGQGPTFGQIEAAKERKAVASGYVGDMSKLADSVLVSFQWNLDKTFGLMAADVEAGKVNPTRYFQVDMKDGGMDVVISPNWKSKISPSAMSQYEQKLAAIKNGTLTVPYNDKK
ncbi:BMP family protein [Actinomadura sp. SCN-SB]|uniref:BMP family protein n=1 Tax=Actinomadura sp. SCN-SB TaxID=3373092 RepID=UPI0037515A85